MQIRIVTILMLFIGLLAGGSVATAEQYELTFSNGSSWRGDDGAMVDVVFNEQGIEQSITGVIKKIDGRPGFQIVFIRGQIAGREATKGIFAPDIVSMKATGGTNASTKSTADATTSGSKKSDPGKPGGTASKPATTTMGDDGYLKSSKPGVFFMPWEGPVGIEARHDEIQAIIAEADKYGPGQIIVLQINSPGGLVIEGDKIHETLKDVKQRHRVVAWIKEAISAAAFTSLHCDEIYFMKVGAMGSAVMFAGQTAISGGELEAWLKKFSEVADIGGRDPIIARCMVTRTAMASYDKDEDTGKVTIYPDMQGEFNLSDDQNVLTLNVDNAMDCGYADGIADTTDELAVLLDLPEWHEVNDSGRKIHERWQRNVKQCRARIPRLQAELQRNPEKAITLLKELLGWYNRCYPVLVYEMNLPPDPDPIRRQIEELRRQRALQRN
ncbi:MAG: ATP-dependent Clp protease proteolytic subunit [Phycisphaerales bacterium]|nr:ATP-dependent Clp protease proteolytic subunit [Phycisphaerales bacterium]